MFSQGTFSKEGKTNRLFSAETLEQCAFFMEDAMLNKTCQTCGTSFTVHKSRENARCCSRDCINKWQKTRTPWNKGLTSERRGSKHPMWSGGRRINKCGYVLVYNAEHPNRYEDNSILEHRYVMSAFLGRELDAKELVHHINGNKQDNAIENLQLTDRVLHRKIHKKVGS